MRMVVGLLPLIWARSQMKARSRVEARHQDLGADGRLDATDDAGGLDVDVPVGRQAQLGPVLGGRVEAPRTP